MAHKMSWHNCTILRTDFVVFFTPTTYSVPIYIMTGDFFYRTTNWVGKHAYGLCSLEEIAFYCFAASVELQGFHCMYGLLLHLAIFTVRHKMPRPQSLGPKYLDTLMLESIQIFGYAYVPIPHIVSVFAIVRQY